MTTCVQLFSLQNVTLPKYFRWTWKHQILVISTNLGSSNETLRSLVPKRTLWKLLCICELRTVAFHAQLFSQQKFRKRNECFSSCPCKCSTCKNGLSTLTLWIFEDNLPLQKFRSLSDAQMHVLLPLTLEVCRPLGGGTKYGKYCDGICHCPAVKFQNRKLMLKKTVIWNEQNIWQ